jgi:hypothetical protein
VVSLINYYGWNKNIFLIKICTRIERERKKKEKRKKIVGSRSWLRFRHVLTWERTASPPISSKPRKVVIEARGKSHMPPKCDDHSHMLACSHALANSNIILQPDWIWKFSHEQHTIYLKNKRKYASLQVLLFQFKL